MVASPHRKRSDFIKPLLDSRSTNALESLSNSRNAKKRKKRLEAIRDKREIYEFVDSASPERVSRLRETIRSLRKTEEEENP